MNKALYSISLASLFTLAFFTAQAQILEDRQLPSNEIKINIANTIIVGSLELGYEYFLDQNQSIGVEVMFMDRFSYVPDSDDDRDFNATSVMLSYNYYFVTAADPSGFYVLPFIKYRGGTFTEVIEDETMEIDLNSFIIGFGTGYKWVHNDKFALGPYINIARGFNSEVSDRFAPVEVNAGFSVGFRF
ncbi:MAG: DUF3575 domain-containing protein [Cyclobacteriaceae bacterium]